MRSQDKTTLSKIVNFKVERTQILGNTRNDDWYVYLGTYKTKERALEVLDEIQKFIERGCKEYKSNGDYYTSKYEYSVFQMPQE